MNNKTGSLYYASDKALYDALCLSAMTKEKVAGLMQSRGVLISRRADKEWVADYFSRLTHDYFDYQEIANAFGSTSRKEKNSTATVNQKVELDELEQVAKAIVEEQIDNGNFAEYLVNKGSLQIRLKYQTYDPNKSEFKQAVKKEAVIILETTDNGLNIRWPANSVVEAVKDELLDKIYQKVDDPEAFEVEVISLENIDSPEVRSHFFLKLIEAIGDYKRFDVTDVSVFHPERDGEADDELGVQIVKASLKGEGVTNSPELKGFHSSGFYISKIVWTAKTDNFDSDMYTFEAQFLDPLNCSNFAYLIRGIHKYSENTKQTSKSAKRVSKAEELKLNKLLEHAARKALRQCQPDGG